MGIDKVVQAVQKRKCLVGQVQVYWMMHGTEGMLVFWLAHTKKLRFPWCQETCGQRMKWTPKTWRIGDAESEISKVVLSVWAAELIRNMLLAICLTRAEEVDHLERVSFGTPQEDGN